MRADQLQKRRHKRGRKRGAALIMVLLAIVVLTVFLTEVQQESSSSFAAAIAERERLKAEYHARSAVNLSRLLLATEPTIRTRVTQNPLVSMMFRGKVPQIPVWKFVDQVMAPYNCPDRAADFTSLAGVSLESGENLGLGGTEGCFEVVIVDEDSKININAGAKVNPIAKQQLAQQLLGLLASPEYNALFEEADLDDQVSTRQAICSAIIDWSDPDEELEACDLSSEAQQKGSEDNYYQTIGLPYFRKNAAFDSLEELRMVRGIGDDFWATFVDPDPRNPDKRVLTVWGSEKVNFNTANAQTLWGLVCAFAVESPVCPGSAAFDPNQAMMFMSTLGMIRSFTAGIPLFAKGSDFIGLLEGKHPMLGPMLQGMGIPPMTFRARGVLEELLTNESKFFSIYAVGVVPGRGRETRVSIHTVLDFRNATDLTNMSGLGGLPGQDGGGLDPSGRAGGAGQPQNQAGNQATAGQNLAATLQSNPGGNTVYWRIQ